jgi:hypothetical protein
VCAQLSCCQVRENSEEKKRCEIMRDHDGLIITAPCFLTEREVLFCMCFFAGE